MSRVGRVKVERSVTGVIGMSRRRGIAVTLGVVVIGAALLISTGTASAVLVRLGLVATATAADGDAFADRVVLEPGTTVLTGTTSGATAEPGEPAVDASGHTVWFSWDAPASGWVYLVPTDVAAPGAVRPALHVYTGTTLDAAHRCRRHRGARR